MLAERSSSPSQWLACGAIGLVVTAVLLAFGRSREVATAVAVPCMVGLISVAGLKEPFVAVLPWLTVAIAQACYLRQHRASLGQFLRRPWTPRRNPAGVKSPVA
jgi:hypothetical protein